MDTGYEADYFSVIAFEQLKEVARQSFASKSSSEAMQISIRFTVQQLNMLLDQIKQLEKMTASMLVEQQNILKSIPGIGVVYAPAILAEILPVFQPELRTGADKLVAHADLDAKPNLSGKNNSLQGKSFKMSKRGSKYRHPDPVYCGYPLSRLQVIINTVQNTII